MAGKTLQAQGVPVPSKLTGPGVRNASQSRSAATPARGGGSSTRRTTSNASKSLGNSQSRTAKRSMPNPVGAGNSLSSGTSGVGLLEAEFLIAGLLLVMLLFANTDNSLADKIMSTMKRGTLVCAVFFFLAIIAGVGPHAAKFSKAFGALIIVAIVITAPVGTVLTDVDNIVKNDWVGTTEHGDDTSADLATASSTTNPTSSAVPTLTQIEKWLKDPKSIGESGWNEIVNAAVKEPVEGPLSLLKKIPGLGWLP